MVASDQRAAQPEVLHNSGDISKEPGVSVQAWGVPGEECRIVVQPVFKDTAQNPLKINLAGQPGQYRVQFLLSRSGQPLQKERNYRFIDDIVGSSHIRIAKPKAERGPHDIEKIVLEPQYHGKSYRIIGETDVDGFLGKFVCELQADSAQIAESLAYGALAPFLSAWSMNVDIPINIETVQVTELNSRISSLRITTPHFEMQVGGGTQPFFLDEFCQYASIYREGLNTNSLFYRFLCFYKIIESLIAKRGREARSKREAGQDPRRAYEVIPEDSDGVLKLLKRLYPWRESWDDLAVRQIFPPEVLGQKLTVLRDKYLRPLRLGIAHALLDSGEITIVLDKMDYIDAVNRWLPLCRICARWMLLTDFPRECSLAMK